MKKSFFLLFSLAFIANFINAQVPRKVVVEHFTNTRCSVCASRNPGFYTNLNAQSGVIHLAIHPSSPYPTCVLSMHNPSENDGRTIYNGVFGGTPVLVIQGIPLSTSANYSMPSIFTPYLGQMSPASIKIRQTKFGVDSIRSTIIIKTMATHSLTNLKLFVALAEDTIFYTGSNGEPRHYDVFRKSYTGTSGVNISLPTTIGDSVVYTKSSPANSAWVFARMFTLAILQDGTTKSVVQSESVAANSNFIISTPTGFKSQIIDGNNIAIFYSEKNIILKQVIKNDGLYLEIFDVTGRHLFSKNIEGLEENINVSNLTEGIYIYSIKNKQTIIKTGKLVIN